MRASTNSYRPSKELKDVSSVMDSGWLYAALVEESRQSLEKTLSRADITSLVAAAARAGLPLTYTLSANAATGSLTATISCMPAGCRSTTQKKTNGC